MSKNHNNLEVEIDKKYRGKDWRKRKRMKVSGKSVFVLQRIIHEKPNPKRRHRNKNT